MATTTHTTKKGDKKSDSSAGVPRSAQEDFEALADQRYWGTAYDALAPWDDENALLHDKRPRVILRLEAQAIDDINSYLFGEQSAPSFSTIAAEDDADDDIITEDDEALLNLQLATLHTRSGLAGLQTEIGRLGLLHGVSAVGFSMTERAGDLVPMFNAEIVDTGASVVTFGHEDPERAAELGIDLDDLLMLDERWRDTQQDKESGELIQVVRRRLWTTDEVVEYEPLDLAEVADAASGSELGDITDIEPDLFVEESVTEHGFGFVPCEWMPNGEFIANDFIGQPLLTEADFTLADAINYTLSQLDRGITYNQEPVTAFLNVMGLNSEGVIERGNGRTVEVQSDPTTTQSADVKLLELEGEGQRVAMEAIKLMKQTFNARAAVVEHNPDDFAGALSGVALERLLAPTLKKVGDLRPSYGKRLSRFLSKMLRAWRGESFFRPVTPQWGPLVQPSITDTSLAVTSAITARDAGLIDQETAVRYTAPYFGVSDVDALVLRTARDAQGTATVITDAEGE